MDNYLVSFSLNNEDDYDKVAESIRRNPKWARVIKNVWIVQTDSKLPAVRESISSILDRNSGGTVLVMNIKNNQWGTYAINKEVTDWMKENI